MSATVEPTVQWSQDQMVEVLLNEPDDFLKVRETLTVLELRHGKRRNSISPAISCISREDTSSFTLRNCLRLMESTQTSL